MKNIFIICCLFIAMGEGLYGQERNPRVRVSVYTFDYVKGHKTIFLADRKKEVTEIRLSTANVLGPFKTTLDAKSNVVLRIQRENKEGVMVYPVIARVKIPSRNKEPLLLLFPAPKGEVYSVFVMDRSLTSFPKGSYKLINFSSTAIRGGVGKTIIKVSPKKITSFTPTTNHEKYMNVHFQYRREGDWKTFGRTRWVNEKEKRSLLCAYLDPVSERMKIRGVSVKPLPPRKKATPSP